MQNVGNWHFKVNSVDFSNEDGKTWSAVKGVEHWIIFCASLHAFGKHRLTLHPAIQLYNWEATHPWGHPCVWGPEMVCQQHMHIITSGVVRAYWLYTVMHSVLSAYAAIVNESQYGFGFALSALIIYHTVCIVS